MAQKTRSVTQLCTNLYRTLALAAVEARMPAGSLPSRLRQLVLDLLALRIAVDRHLLPSESLERARDFFCGEELSWQELGDLLDVFANRLGSANEDGKLGRESLWPFNEYLEMIDLTEAVRPLWVLDSEMLKVRTLGDAYQTLREIPPPHPIFAEEAGEKLKASRRRLGLYFTPEEIVRRICKLAVPKAQRGAKAPYVCDPAMGSGHFLIAMAWHLGGGDVQAARHIASTRLYGVDIDAEAVRLTRLSFWLEFSTPLMPFEAPLHFIQGDSLVGGAWELEEREEAARMAAEMDGLDWYVHFPEIARRGGFDVIVGNPPYDVLTGFSKHPELRGIVDYMRNCGLYEHSLGGQLNLYRLFMERSLGLLKKKGAFSFIIPASFLTDKVAAPLRRDFLLHHGLSRVEHYHESERGIEGVGQSLMIFLAHKQAGMEAQVRLCGRVGSREEGKRKDQRISTETVCELDPELMPLPMAQPQDWKLLKWLTERCTGHFSEIAQGSVGELDQTVFATHMRDDEGVLLIRGCHVAPFAADLSTTPARQRFVHEEFFLEQKGDNADAVELRAGQERIAQLGIRNMESRPRLVAARIREKTYFGNSVNCWLPRHCVPGHLITALLNCALYDWRFRLTSSNNNINVYEVNNLPLPEKLVRYFFDRTSLTRSARNRYARILDELQQVIDTIERAAQHGQTHGQKTLAMDGLIGELFELPKAHREWIHKQ